MANLTHIQPYGEMLKALFDDGSSKLAVPTNGGLWIVSGAGSGPIPGTGLTDWWTATWGQGSLGDWESHASYSQGGTDWSLPYGTTIKAPADGTLVNYGNTDGAGLKSILIFDSTYPRTIAASTTLMNGVYTEDAVDPAASMVFQHLDSQSAAGHYNKGDTIALSGNSAGPGSTGATHLHAHLLAGTTIDDRRMDFMKFL